MLKTEKREKASWVGVPAVFKLNLACMHINEAFGESYGCFLVGSALEKPDWRDVDVVLIMGEDEFAGEFPNAVIDGGAFEHNPKWMLNSIGISMWLREQTGLPVDFKTQPQKWANRVHRERPRHPLGMRYPKQKEDAR